MGLYLITAPNVHMGVNSTSATFVDVSDYCPDQQHEQHKPFPRAINSQSIHTAVSTTAHLLPLSTPRVQHDPEIPSAIPNGPVSILIITITTASPLPSLHTLNLS